MLQAKFGPAPPPRSRTEAAIRETPRGRFLLASVAALVAWAIVEAVSLLGLWYLGTTGSKIAYGPISADFLAPEDTAAIGRLLHQRHDYYAPRGRLRVAAFGDSYTHGDEVENTDTWEAILEARDSSLEVLNFGVSAYGLDQAYLRYRLDGRRYHPHVVLIGVLADDVNRGVNVWRPFYSPGADMPVAKPRLLLDGDSVVLLANPLVREAYWQLLARPDSVLRALGEHDWYYHHKERASALDVLPSVRMVKLALRVMAERRTGSTRSGLLREGSEAVRVAAATLDKFAADVLRDGAIPVIVIFPSRPNLERYRRDGHRVADPLIRHARAAGIRVADMHAAFDDCARTCRRWSFVDHHMSSLGNRRVARRLQLMLAGLPGPVPKP